MAYNKLKNRLFEFNAIGDKVDLLKASLTFIRERCTDLRFDTEKEAEETRTDKYLGSSITPNIIPYNMQMDVDRLCLENALKRFLQSGNHRDAFDVYFCYIEMFIGKYDSSRKIIEMLSEYEVNGSSLLIKHRDHYSHSVYVFALGLAIFETNSKFRDIYSDFYKHSDEQAAAHHFLKHWGLSSLFHDIGYPFELPFEQVESYFDVQKQERKGSPYMVYNGLDKLVSINEKTHSRLKDIYGKNFSDTNSVFAFDISKKLGKAYRIDSSGLEVILRNKPSCPQCFNYFMDHAYFSTMLLFRELCKIENYTIEASTIDSLTAILLHNSLYKFSIAFYKSDLNIPFKAELHPLAYMLMLCDELQCWNRTSYGRNSRTELHPMDCIFDFSNGNIKATYVYDKNEKSKINNYIEACKKNPKAKLKAFSGMYIKENEEKSGFLADIESIVDTSIVGLNVTYTLGERVSKLKGEYLSNSRFIHLYNFAVALNCRYYEKTISADEQTAQFDKLSLEYMLYNIGQAKAFDKYLNAIDCYYTDKEVNFEMVEHFSNEDVEKIGPMEHSRWVREHWAMGWKYGTPANKSEREQTRTHSLMMDYPTDKSEEDIEQLITKHYNGLTPEEQGKDTEPMNRMLELIKEFEGLRIYKLK